MFQVRDWVFFALSFAGSSLTSSYHTPDPSLFLFLVVDEIRGRGNNGEHMGRLI